MKALAITLALLAAGCIGLERFANDTGVPVVEDTDQEILEWDDLSVDPSSVEELLALDVRPKQRHLLLMARTADEGQGSSKQKFLCGHDEREWFVAAVPDRLPVTNVQTAMEALKPAAVRMAQNRKRSRRKNRQRRKNEAYLRQGEWFFLPHPELDIEPLLVLRNEPISRGAGKSHICEWLYRAGGETVHVCRDHPFGLTTRQYENLLRRRPQAKQWGWTVMRRDMAVFVRGRISHPDHKTLKLRHWHLVQMNTENQAPAMRHVTFLD